MALIRCPECKQKISSDCTTCPKCGADIKKAQNRQSNLAKSIALIFGGFIFLCIVVGLMMKPEKTSDSSVAVETTSNENTIPILEDVTQYGKISSDDLIQKLGEPVAKEEWTNKTSKGDFNVITYSYDINTNHYEFIIAEDLVVRLTMYSNKYWNNTGELFSFNDFEKEQLPQKFGITLSEQAEIKEDNNFTYIISPVSDGIEVFDVQDIDAKNKTFGLVKVTFDSNYFD